MSLTSELRSGYLDDVSLGGDESDTTFVGSLKGQGDRSEPECVGGGARADTIDLEDFSDFYSVDPSDACLLGAPI